LGSIGAIVLTRAAERIFSFFGFLVLRALRARGRKRAAPDERMEGWSGMGSF